MVKEVGWEARGKCCQNGQMIKNKIKVASRSTNEREGETSIMLQFEPWYIWFGNVTMTSKSNNIAYILQ